MNTTIVPAAETDIEFMLEVDRLFFEAYVTLVDGAFDESVWRGYLKGDIPRAYVLRNGEDQIGYFRYSIINDDPSPYIYLRVIAVIPNRQGNGYGKLLYEFFESHVREERFRTVKLRCPMSSIAIDWYPKLGYRVIQQEESATLYEKELG